LPYIVNERGEVLKQIHYSKLSNTEAKVVNKFN